MKIINEWGQQLHRCWREDFEQALRVTRLDVLEVCFRISQSERRRLRSCVEDGLVLTVIGRCALVDWLGVGGGRIQTG